MAERGLAPSRARAKRLIESGSVVLNGRVADKPSLEVAGDPDVTVTEERFVGRGGEKLAHALRTFGIDPTGLRAVDIGASTGGFTDCLLQNGASHVVAVDAGCGQLHPRLLADPRVTNIEKYNARALDARDIGEICDIVVMDVSFISQTYIIPNIPAVLADGGLFIGLIKPQFEAGKSKIGKGGIVKDLDVHAEVCRRVIDFARGVGLSCIGLIKSPITGGDGNREYLAAYKKGGAGTEIDIKQTVYSK